MSVDAPEAMTKAFALTGRLRLKLRVLRLIRLRLVLRLSCLRLVCRLVCRLRWSCLVAFGRKVECVRSCSRVGSSSLGCLGNRPLHAMCRQSMARLGIGAGVL